MGGVDKGAPLGPVWGGGGLQVEVDGIVFGRGIIQVLSVVTRPDNVLILCLRQVIEALTGFSEEVELLARKLLVAPGERIIVYAEHHVIKFAVDRLLIHLCRVIAQNGTKAALGRLSLDVHVPTVQ